MSLLMDALKKAEREKKESAKLQQENAGNTEEEQEVATSKKLDSTDTWGHEIVDGSSTAEMPVMQNTGRHSTTAEMELEPITNADNTAEISDIDIAAASSQGTEDPTLNVTMSELSLAELSSDGISIDAEDAADQTYGSREELQAGNTDLLDETFHGVALDHADINPELFQETMQGDAFLEDGDASQTWGETLPGIPAAQLTKDIGSEDQPTPVAAQTVFAATGTTRSGVGFKWIITGLGTVFLAAATVYYYFTITPTNRASLSPQIAQGIEKVGPPLHETLDLNIMPETGVPAGGPDSATSTENVTGTLISEEGTVAQGIEDQESSSLEEQAISRPAAVAQETTESVADPVVGTGVVAMVSAAEEVAPGSQDPEVTADLPEDIGLEPALIKISRSKAPDDRGKVIRDAYFAYQKGAYGTAVEKYQQALKEFPDNRDALLGLGAVASNNGDYDTAFSLYARVLKLNPGDQFAKAALINLQDRSVLLKSESVIHSMLHDNPDTHFLHFTLGNIYAASSRWAEAQQAFFDAYRLNASNPDYALNLAVSLDHIGQYGAALDYYNTAMELADNTPVSFDSPSVRKRINKLNQVAEH